MEKSAVRTEVLLVVPGQVPSLSRCHTAAFTPNACHAHLHKHNNVTKQQAYEALGGFTLQTKHKLSKVCNVLCDGILDFSVIHRFRYVAKKIKNILIRI